MNPKLIRLLAVAATVLVVVSGVNRLMRPQVVSEPAPKKKSVVANTGKETDTPCTIKRAPFGGTQASLIKVMKGKVAHYIVLDHPGRQPDGALLPARLARGDLRLRSSPCVMGEFCERGRSGDAGRQPVQASTE